MTLLIEFARIGLGIACVIEDFITSDLSDGTLIEVPLEVPIPRRIIGFAYHSQDMSDTLKEFLDFCRNDSNCHPI